MGVLCSTVDKTEDEPTEDKAQNQSLSQTSHRLPKMPKIVASTKETRSAVKWEERILKGVEYLDVNDYDNARAQLQLAEKRSNFDAEIAFHPLDYEEEAAELVRKIRIYDWHTTYGILHDEKGHPKKPRPGGEHFLGNVDLINKTELFKVAKKMPKGAHLHVHFNSCLPQDFLILQARDVEAMYIKSNVHLTTKDPQSFVTARIAFNVMTKDNATKYKDAKGVESHRPLGNIFDVSYIPDTWMSYKEFQSRFPLYSESALLKGANEAETWLAQKMLISEDEAHGVHQTSHGIWEQFNYRTQMMKGLFAYETAFRSYTRACIQDFANDNIQYAEIRPNFMYSNSLKSDDGQRMYGNRDIVKIIEEELEIQKEKINAANGQYFGGMKVIYCTPRSFSNEEVRISLNECIDLKAEFSDLICGFDLVGHEEMGNELHNFVPEFLEFQKKCKDLSKPGQPFEIPFLFHCGETLSVGGKVDGNLYDAILLNAKRIGHGYALARHPFLMKYFKEKNIAIESCPISNEILGLTPAIAGHNLPILLANDVPCTINSDNATFYRSSLSHDFYQVMIGSESMSLFGWKQLAKWSLEHSCMNEAEMHEVTQIWHSKWAEFCKWIVETYSPMFAAATLSTADSTSNAFTTNNSYL